MCHQIKQVYAWHMRQTRDASIGQRILKMYARMAHAAKTDKEYVELMVVSILDRRLNDTVHSFTIT